MRVDWLGFWLSCLLVVAVLAGCGNAVTAIPEAASADAAVEELVLQEVVARICPSPEDADRIDPYERYFRTQDPFYSASCVPATGHDITVTMRRFDDAAEAEAEFRSRPELGPVEEVQGYPVSDWEEDHPSFPGGRAEVRVRLMQVGRWLVELRSFDDTHFITAPDPREASVAVMDVMAEEGLVGGE